MLTHYSKKKKEQHNVNFFGVYRHDPNCYLLCTTEALTFTHIACQKQAELIACLSTLQSTICRSKKDGDMLILRECFAGIK